jgi:hypothetical protein
MKVHIAIGVADVERSLDEYSRLAGSEPELVVAGEYALWRTEVLNLSIRRVTDGVGTVRHVGFERDDVASFSAITDQNGVVWETFCRQDQLKEIELAWPGSTANIEQADGDVV